MVKRLQSKQGGLVCDIAKQGKSGIEASKACREPERASFSTAQQND